MLIIRTLVAFFLLLLCGCEKQAVPECDGSTGLFTIANYSVGAAIEQFQLNQDSAYRSIAIRQFNSITAENIFKAEYLHPLPELYNWQEADSLVAFCMHYNKRVHGHTLVWHKQLPGWIYEFKGNRNQWDSLLKSHIQTIVSHFGNTVKSWDVVNEAFNEDGTLRNNIWLQNLGSGYIEKAFRYAHEAAPDVLLFYNDYNLELNPAKLKSVLSLLNSIRNRGVRVDGIGLQMHISIDYPDQSQITAALSEISGNDYLVHLSELDISVNPQNKEITFNQSLLQRQADVLANIVLVYNQLPQKYRYGITFWGITDRYTWIRSEFNRMDYPLLFDDNYNPKPCFCKLVESL
jgi:endo-1,4-beta-xylanase